MARRTVETSSGTLEGLPSKNNDGETFFSFKGIPYAKPPIGDLRFQDPLPPDPWIGVRKAHDFGQKCAQSDSITKSISGSDDCLYLNVYTKTTKSNSLQPVMFWIHGGGFTYGQGDDYFYGPEYLLRKSCNLVLVTINYRLGVFGFLNLQHKAATGNQGLKDQVMALKWVKKNISKFGGDPNNVTIAGGSAGAGSVHYLCLSPWTKNEGLFHKAILQSGVVPSPWTAMSYSPEYAYRLCEYLGKKITDPEEIVNFLRGFDCHKLAEAQQKIINRKEIIQIVFGVFLPTVDYGSDRPFIPEPVEKLVLAGIHVPSIIGQNTLEGTISFMAGNPNLFETLNKSFADTINPINMRVLKEYDLTPEEIKRWYFGNEIITRKTHLKQYLYMFNHLMADLFIHDTVRIQTEKSACPTYMYTFSYDKGFSLMKKMTGTEHIRGSSHFDEKAYLFPSKILQVYGVGMFRKGTSDYKVMEHMTTLWYNFAKYGCPTPANVNTTVPINWEPVTDGKIFRQLVIDEELKMESLVSTCEKYRNKKI